VVVEGTGLYLYLKATIPAGSNNANGIIPHPLVIATPITPETIKMIPSIFVLVLITNVITSVTM
jgi:hypothetical protein